MLICLLTVALLAAVSLPSLAGGKARSERLVCLNNLRLIGQAFQRWGDTHHDRVPWRERVYSGGTLPTMGSKVGNAWLELSILSNELATPRILVCPSDGGVHRVAKEFSTSLDGGFLNFNYRGNSLSYFIGLDVFADFPSAVLAGDRNLSVDTVNGGCSSGVNNAAGIYAYLPELTTGWTNGVHGNSGNLLLNDGQVRETSTDGLRAAMRVGDDNGFVHLLMPR